jgi:hypothetical protein
MLFFLNLYCAGKQCIAIKIVQNRMNLDDKFTTKSF